MEFRLRFPLDEVQHWAKGYSYEDDVPIEVIGRAVRERGYYTREEFLDLCGWKARRNLPRCKRNDPGSIEYATRVALSPENKFEPLRIGSLTLLEGVDWPVASVLLHFGHQEPYPILDFRALWSLGFDEKPQWYNFKFWWQYVECCRELQSQAGVDAHPRPRPLAILQEASEIDQQPLP